MPGLDGQCRKCRFSERTTLEHFSFWCRRYPPCINMEFMNDKGEMDIRAIPPIVQGYDTCGEYQEGESVDY